MKIMDLSIPINDKTPVYPGDPKQEINQTAHIEKEGWNEHRLTFNTHFSTHIDAPYHMLKDGKKLSEYSLDKLIGEGVVIDVRNGFDLNILDNSQIKKDSIVLLWTGQTKKLYSGYFENARFIPREFAEKLVKLGVKVVGLDSFSPDEPPFDVHKILLKHDILIVENLTNLDKLTGGNFRVFILPLKLENTDGAPCRVIALLD